MANQNFTLMNTTEMDSNIKTDKVDTMKLIHSIIASVGIVTNLTVVIAFLNHKKLRKKIPNICIVHQVSY